MKLSLSPSCIACRSFPFLSYSFLLYLSLSLSLTRRHYWWLVHRVFSQINQSPASIVSVLQEARMRQLSSNQTRGNTAAAPLYVYMRVCV